MGLEAVYQNDAAVLDLQEETKRREILKAQIVFCYIAVFVRFLLVFLVVGSLRVSLLIT